VTVSLKSARFFPQNGYKNIINNATVTLVPTGSDVGENIGDLATYITGSGAIVFDVSTLSSLPTGTDKLTLFSTTTALDLTKFSVTGNSDYYLQQNAQNAETNPGAVTLQLHAAKDTAGNYYDGEGAISLALTGNKVLTILDSQGETYATTFDAVYDDTTKELFLAVAQIGETKYPSLAAAKTDLGSNEGTITLLRNSEENISLAVGQVLNTNGKSYTGTVSPTGDCVELASGSGIYMAVDNSSNSWIGATGGAWGMALNWSNGVVPNTYTAVTLPDKNGASYTIGVTSDDKCGTMEVNGNVTLFRATDGWKQLHINGNISGSGTLTLNMVGLRADSGNGITVSCGFVGDGGTDNAFVAGKPFTFTKPVIIRSATGYFKSEGVAVVFEDAVTIEEGATLKSHSGTIQSGSDIVLRSSTGIKASGGSLMLSDGILSGSGSAIITDNYNMSFTLRTSIVSTSNFSVGNTDVAALTVDDGGVVKVGSASSHKWFTFLTGNGKSDGNFLTINEGGTVEACVITFDGNASERCPYSISFNGGTLKAYASTSETYNNYKLIHNSEIAVKVLSGGAVFDISANKTANVVPVIATGVAEGKDGGLTKTGEGSLVLEAVPTYNGKTKVVAGALYLPSGYTPDLDVTTQETISDKAGYKKYVFAPAARFGGVSYNTAAEAIADAVTAGSGTVTLLRDCVEEITLVSEVSLTLNAASETTPTLTTTSAISLSRGQTITLGEGVTLTPAPISADPVAKVIFVDRTYKVVYGTTFTVY